ncbi:MAG: Trm112 family protein [Deltaproteobacteria bacterium]|nr:Trm112 family protein [Deltaproteobacteria bacterium]
MALNKALIDILACPKCKGSLVLKADESEFQCKSCKLAYQVIEGIPNFIVEEAKPLEAA